MNGGVAVGYSSNAYCGDGKVSGGVAIGYYANARHSTSTNSSGAVAVGHMSNGYFNGVGIGKEATGYYQGVAVGYLATGTQCGVGIGYMANGYVCGTAVGYRANAGNSGYSFAKGSFSRCMRYNEEWKGSDTLSEDPLTGQIDRLQPLWIRTGQLPRRDRQRLCYGDLPCEQRRQTFHAPGQQRRLLHRQMRRCQ